MGLCLQTQALGRGERKSPGEELVAGISLTWGLFVFRVLHPECWHPGLPDPESNVYFPKALPHSTARQLQLLLRGFLGLARILPSPHVTGLAVTSTGWQSQHTRGQQQEVLCPEQECMSGIQWGSSEPRVSSCQDPGASVKVMPVARQVHGRVSGNSERLLIKVKSPAGTH